MAYLPCHGHNVTLGSLWNMRGPVHTSPRGLGTGLVSNTVEWEYTSCAPVRHADRAEQCQSTLDWTDVNVGSILKITSQQVTYHRNVGGTAGASMPRPWKSDCKSCYHHPPRACTTNKDHTSTTIMGQTSRCNIYWSAPWWTPPALPKTWQRLMASSSAVPGIGGGGGHDLTDVRLLVEGQEWWHNHQCVLWTCHNCS